MCGIAGFWRLAGHQGEAPQQLKGMIDALRHRGPDDQGQWIDLSAGVALGHRRLSVVDLSPQGHQPMCSASGRYVITYNGEVYNFEGLRREEEARGTKFRGHSDTEVMLSVIERLGVLEATRRFAGMFAFAVWDRSERVLHLVRDRIGEKPLYYGWAGRTLLFASELKSLRAHPDWCGEIDRGAVALYLRYNHVPAPWSIYAGFKKVEAATILSVESEGAAQATRYWDLAEAIRQGIEHPLAGGEAAIIEQLEHRLTETIREEMLSDVPLGAFLSGGIDSSTIVSLMQAQSARPVRTFTIGFHEAAYDEARQAREVAHHLGAEHTELYVTPEDARSVIPLLPQIYDEPFGDSSQIPTYLVARLAREQVTVALSGDGGDEMFAGYNRYFHGPRIWNRLAPIPIWLRRSMARGIQAVSPRAWDGMVGTAQRLLLRPGERVARSGDQMHKLAAVLTASSEGTMYRTLTSNWTAPEDILPGRVEPPTTGTGSEVPEGLSFAERMMCMDTRTYLPDNILVKVDRATMAVSLESRAPFLDHRVVELAWRIPLNLKLRAGKGKWVLRRLLERRVPKELTERPKMGFGVPIDSWLRGPLRPWAESLLEPERLQSEGLFDAGVVRQRWQEHQAGARNLQSPLWNLLMFQAWRAA